MIVVKCVFETCVAVAALFGGQSDIYVSRNQALWSPMSRTTGISIQPDLACANDYCIVAWTEFTSKPAGEIYWAVEHGKTWLTSPVPNSYGGRLPSIALSDPLPGFTVCWHGVRDFRQAVDGVLCATFNGTWGMPVLPDECIWLPHVLN
jgi:hypothetical protein